LYIHHYRFTLSLKPSKIRDWKDLGKKTHSYGLLAGIIILIGFERASTNSANDGNRRVGSPFAMVITAGKRHSAVSKPLKASPSLFPTGIFFDGATLGLRFGAGTSFLVSLFLYLELFEVPLYFLKI